MARKRKPLPFARSRSSLIFMAVSVSILLLMLSSASFFSKKEDTFLKQRLDSNQIRAAGLQLYNSNCLRCHGVNGRGTSFGPPLVHPLYHADKLSDQAFTQAVLYGAMERHWSFGPMMRIDGLSQMQIAQILAYVRVEQNKGTTP